jgi:hypothetical protein
MNMLHDGDRRDPTLPAGHPALASGIQHAAKAEAATLSTLDPVRPATRQPARIRKVDCGEVYRFWAFR